MNPIKEGLIAVRERLAPEGAWTQRKFAGNERGETLMGNDPTATCWCLTGAVCRVQMDRRMHDADAATMNLLIGDAIRRRHGDWWTVVSFNDYGGRTHEEILQVVDSAIGLAP